MEIKIIGDNIEITSGLEKRIKDKLEKLNKYGILKEDTPCNVLIRTMREEQIVEVAINLGSKRVIRAEKRASDLYAAIDMVESTLSRQIRKEKEKAIGKKRSCKKDAEHHDMEEEKQFNIKEKKISLILMDVEEAIEQMEMLGHDFYLFLNSDTGNVSVVYKKKVSGYGLIHTAA